MPDVKDTRTVIDSLRRCCHAGVYDDTGPGESCDGCAYYGKCQDLELDAAELILLLDDLTDHQFWINHDAIKELRHCSECDGHYSECPLYDMCVCSGFDRYNKLQADAADILEKMYHRYNIMHDGPERAEATKNHDDKDLCDWCKNQQTEKCADCNVPVSSTEVYFVNYEAKEEDKDDD